MGLICRTAYLGPEFDEAVLLELCGLPRLQATDSIPLMVLRELALCLINKDRADYGLPPLALGSNPSAQLHAEDMISNHTYGHWWADGRKPYMVYSETGGTSYINENVGASGWTDRNWATLGCAESFFICEVPSLAESIIENQYSFMYEDAHADWGHRDNILYSGHRVVNIGIAADERRVIVVQHFEGGIVEARGRPTLSSSGQLSFTMDKKESGVAIADNTIYVYHDPPLSTMTLTGERISGYCIGGGTATVCASPIAYIYDPPPVGEAYDRLDRNKIVASHWKDNDSQFSFQADMKNLLHEPGIYTLALWNTSEELLIALTIAIEGEYPGSGFGVQDSTPVPSPTSERAWPTSTPTSTPLPDAEPTPTLPPHPSSYCAEWREMVLNWIREGNVFPYGDVPVHPSLSVEDTNYYCNLEFPTIYLDAFDRAEVGYGYYRSGNSPTPQLLPGLYQYFANNGDERVEGLNCALITNIAEDQHSRVAMSRGEVFVYRLETHHGEVSLAVTDSEGRQQCFGILLRIGD